MIDPEQIKKNVKDLLSGIPSGITVVAAAKTRTAPEINAAIEAGISAIGENYFQEAASVRPLLKGNFEFHYIGRIQSNKAKRIAGLFDKVQTLSGLGTAEIIDRYLNEKGEKKEFFIEVNIASEKNKSGVLPDDLESFASGLSAFPALEITGLMTMGPFDAGADEMKRYFQKAKNLFERLKDKSGTNMNMKYLSMGMSGTYHLAIECGANMVRIGTGIFGERREAVKRVES